MNISYDLQITLIGHGVVRELFRTISRNITERWAIRYNKRLQVDVRSREASFLKTSLTDVQVVKTGAKSQKADICITYIPGHRKNQDADSLKIASYLRGAKKNMFIWLIPGEWLEEDKENSILYHPINVQLISLGQVVQAIERQEAMEDPILHVLELDKRKSTYRYKGKNHSFKPWAYLPPQNDPAVEETIQRRIPHQYELMRSTVNDLRFHGLPWSKQGCHLDFAPRWIDLFIYDALGWKREHIID